MTKQIPFDEIENLVGAKRHKSVHIAKAVSKQEMVFILHSQNCLETLYGDLTRCPYSAALDQGIRVDEWAPDRPLPVAIVDGRLIPDSTITTRSIHLLDGGTA